MIRPEIEFIQFINSFEDAEINFPSLLDGNGPTSKIPNSIGSHDFRKTPRGVIFGRAFDPDDVKELDRLFVMPLHCQLRGLQETPPSHFRPIPGQVMQRRQPAMSKGSSRGGLKTEPITGILFTIGNSTNNSTNNNTRSLQPPRNSNGSDRTSDLGRYIEQVETFSCNSVRGPPDPILLSEDIPDDLTTIPPFLFHPRVPPVLPQHILNLPFGNVLRRYTRLAKLVDDYQRWHTHSVFGFWTEQDYARAASGEAPSYTKALNIDRPSIPPYVLDTRFDNVLISSPVLSHLIERYHNDLGYDYFAFFHNDPRDNLADPNPAEEDGPNESISPPARITECLQSLEQYAFDWGPYTSLHDRVSAWIDGIKGAWPPPDARQ
ncbi:hypothetical protein F5Y09DRAFT_349617 [Xylaria sp. FL1042]|nr:hypothetical protein F5Y09DRAFT_349530 [Xylaria sp. FL1042]KAI0435415.1 hypothetical protein F5Y09DRAFT_349617 [Xylaria sp. FL1042]